MKQFKVAQAVRCLTPLQDQQQRDLASSQIKNSNNNEGGKEGTDNKQNMTPGSPEGVQSPHISAPAENEKTPTILSPHTLQIHQKLIARRQQQQPQKVVGFPEAHEDQKQHHDPTEETRGGGGDDKMKLQPIRRIGTTTNRTADDAGGDDHPAMTNNQIKSPTDRKKTKTEAVTVPPLAVYYQPQQHTWAGGGQGGNGSGNGGHKVISSLVSGAVNHGPSPTSNDHSPPAPPVSNRRTGGGTTTQSDVAADSADSAHRGGENKGQQDTSSTVSPGLVRYNLQSKSNKGDGNDAGAGRGPLAMGRGDEDGGASVTPVNLLSSLAEIPMAIDMPASCSLSCRLSGYATVSTSTCVDGGELGSSTRSRRGRAATTSVATNATTATTVTTATDEQTDTEDSTAEMHDDDDDDDVSSDSAYRTNSRLSCSAQVALIRSLSGRSSMTLGAADQQTPTTNTATTVGPQDVHELQSLTPSRLNVAATTAAGANTTAQDRRATLNPADADATAGPQQQRHGGGIECMRNALGETIDDGSITERDRLTRFPNSLPPRGAAQIPPPSLQQPHSERTSASPPASTHSGLSRRRASITMSDGTPTAQSPEPPGLIKQGSGAGYGSGYGSSDHGGGSANMTPLRRGGEQTVILSSASKLKHTSGGAAVSSKIISRRVRTRHQQQQSPRSNSGGRMDFITISLIILAFLLLSAVVFLLRFLTQLAPEGFEAAKSMSFFSTSST